MLSKRKYLSINSADRSPESLSTSDFKILLQYPIKCKKAKLISASITNTYFNITNSNNSLILNGTVTSFGNGCYSWAQLVAVLGGVFSSVTYDDINCRIILGLSSSQTLTFPQVGSIYGSINSVLGFPRSYNLASNTHTSSYPPSLDQFSLFIDVAEFSNNYITSNNVNSSFCVNVNANKNDVIFFSSMSQYGQSINECHVKDLLNMITIKVRDQYGNILQGLPEWNMLIEFE